MVVLYYLFLFFIILLSFPLQVGIAIIIVFTSGFPVLFKQKRVGFNNKPFIMYKFRTMKVGSEQLRNSYLSKNEADGPVFKIYNDPRYYPFGKFLSHTGLDELPQLWNVLKGEMALIGPRPLPEYEANILTIQQKKRLTIQPGIISPWVLEGYHSKPFAHWMKSDLDYIKKKSFIYDIRLSMRMVPYLVNLILRECF
jgi:lipopolysaccharide/colanic/teichoic acid biosynthesis glycosyltransferase